MKVKVAIPAFAAALVAGLIVGLASPGTSSSVGSEAALLTQAWDVQKTASLYNKWRAQNQGEAQKLDAYWATGGTAPTLATAYGRSWVLVAQAYWSLSAPPPTTPTPTPTPSPTTPTPTPTPSPTPGTLTSPIGHHNAACCPGFWPLAHIGKYGYVSTDGQAPFGFVGVQLIYRSAITGNVGYTNFSEQEIIANGWAMRDAGGNIMRSAYGVLADPGNASYQAAWAARTLQKITEQTPEGYWADDFTPRVDTLATCHCYPANRPNVDAMKQAFISFATYMEAYFGSRGLKTAYNTQMPLDNDGSQTTTWITQLGPRIDYFTVEGWLTPNGFLRITGTAWNQVWDQYRNMHKVAQSVGTGWLPYEYDTDAHPEAQVQAYTLGTFMLDWDGTKEDGFSVFLPQNPQTRDAWIPFYDQALALGRPTAATVDSGTTHTRRFEHGTLTVNSGTGTATIGP